MTNQSAAPDAGGDKGYRAIPGAYTLFSRIPVFQDRDGLVHADQLWAIDLLEHLNYIPDFRLCCPVRDIASAPGDAEPLPDLPTERLIPLREDKGWLSVAANFIPNFFTVLRAARRTQIAHGGLAGWAFPPDYYLLALRPFLSFQWIVNMESSFWMKQVGVRPTLRQWLRHHVHLTLGRACMRAADIRMFTQSWYRDTLLCGDKDRTLINEASWVDEKDVLDDDALAALQAQKSGPVKLLMPTRLIQEKGVATLLEAIDELEQRLTPPDGAPALIVDIIGSGHMETDIRAFLARHPGRAVQLSFLDPVPYGAAFFAILARYDAILVANLKEEQPRILYDAFSQGVPSIASRTSGVLQVVEDGKTSLLFSPGSAHDLADRMAELVDRRDTLSAMGVEALRFAQGRTHQAMHRQRAQFLHEHLNLS